MSTDHKKSSGSKKGLSAFEKAFAAARKKAGELALKGYQKAKPIIKETSKSLKKTIKENLKK